MTEEQEIVVFNARIDRLVADTTAALARQLVFARVLNNRLAQEWHADVDLDGNSVDDRPEPVEGLGIEWGWPDEQPHGGFYPADQLEWIAHSPGDERKPCFATTWLGRMVDSGRITREQINEWHRIASVQLEAAWERTQ